MKKKKNDCVQLRKGRPVTKSGTVVEIDSRDPKRVRTDTCPGKFRKVLEICKHHSTSNDFK